MKTTIDLDEVRLKSVMRLTGIKTRKEAIDRALAELERRARVEQMLAKPWDMDSIAASVDPDYDVKKLRRMGLKRHAHR